MTTHLVHDPFRRRLAVIVSLTAVLFTGTACSDSADPAEVKDLSAKFTSSQGPLGIPVSKESAECRAEVYLESDLSDKALEALKETGEVAPHTEKDRGVLRQLADKLARECL